MDKEKLLDEYIENTYPTIHECFTEKDRLLVANTMGFTLYQLNAAIRELKEALMEEMDHLLYKAKIKKPRIRIIRPEVNVEFMKPILGRLIFLIVLPRMVSFKRVKLNACGYVINVFFIGIPKITFGAEE